MGGGVSAVGAPRPVPSVTVADLLRRSYEQFSSRTAVIQDDGAITYGELGGRALRVAAALRAHGLVHGDRVVLLTSNRTEFFEVEHAAFLGGFVRLALSPRLHPKEVAHILRDAGARALFVDPEWAGRLGDVLAGCLDVALAVGFGEPTPDAPLHMSYGDLLAGSPDAEPVPWPVESEDIAALLYTSGTTGLPKGAALSHRNWVAMMRNCLVEMPPLDESDLLLHVAPLSHFSGYTASPCFARGAGNLVLPRFDARETLQALRGHPVTILPMVPTMINMVTAAAEDEGGEVKTSLRAVIYGGAAIAPDRLRRATRVFGDVFLQFYGLSETPMPLTSLSRAAHMFDPAEPVPERLASAGRVNPFVELRLVGDDGADVQRGEVGEIVVRGDTVMRGYWNKPDETAQMIDADGWAATGDLGRMDAEGYLYVVDRKKDMIVTGGYNVYPTEVENAIATLPGVAEVAVVGAPDERFGECIVAVVALRPGHTVTDRDVVGVCTDQLADYKKPRMVLFVDELPKTGSGKIQRKRIREPLWAAETRRVGG
jgi:acyl-CoA synthetase (AMP-forming)/AMP-acid ligase II